MKPNSDGGIITVTALNHLGEEIPIGNAESIIYSSSDGAVVSVDENGYMTPNNVGTATISAEVTIDGITQTGYGKLLKYVKKWELISYFRTYRFSVA